MNNPTGPYKNLIARYLINRISGLVLISAFIAIVYLPVLLGHASLKTNNIPPQGPLFVGDPSAGGAITVPLERLVARAWSHLQIPMINPFQGFGIPLLPSQGVAVFIPEILVHLLLPNHYSIWNLLRLDGIAYGTFLLSYSLELGFTGSIAAGVLAALAGVAPPEVNLGMLNPLMVLPFILLAIRYLLDPSFREVFVAWLGLLTALLLLALSGFQELFPILVIVVATYAVAIAIHFRTFQTCKKRINGLISAGIIALVIGAVGYLPTLAVVDQGFGVNGPTAYLASYGNYLLGTLAIPQIGGPSLVISSASQITTIWILGTPFIGIAVIMPIIACLRYERKSIWLVCSSLLLMSIGILGFSNDLGILRIFDFFPFNAIIMTRFLGFIWWIPLCLLLAFTFSNAKLYSFIDIVASLLLSVIADLFLYRGFTDASKTFHYQINTSQSFHALVIAILFIVLFLGAIVFSSLAKGTWLALAIVLFATFISVPKNFYPKGSSQPATDVLGNKLPPSKLLVDFHGYVQPPDSVASINIYGPLMSPTYLAFMDRAFPYKHNQYHYRAVRFSAPTLFYVKINSNFFTVLKSFGVNEFVTPTKINLSPAVPNCLDSLRKSSIFCYLGKARINGNITRDTSYTYQITNVDPLVFPAHEVSPTKTSDEARNKILNLIDRRFGLPPIAYIATDLPQDGLSLASDPVGLQRKVSTEAVTTQVKTSSNGLIILRNSYLSGMTCAVNNRPTTCFSVDGGLWTAVKLPAGKSQVQLNYVDNAIKLEVLIAIIGTTAVSLGWVMLLLIRLCGFGPFLTPFLTRKRSSHSATQKFE